MRTRGAVEEAGQTQDGEFFRAGFSRSDAFKALAEARFVIAIDSQHDGSQMSGCFDVFGRMHHGEGLKRGVGARAIDGAEFAVWGVEGL